MNGTEVIVAGCVLALTVGCGLVAHEWAHALTLRLFRIEYTISYFPDRNGCVVGALRSCPWAVVHPHPTGREPAWPLRIAALAPFGLAVPVFVLGVNGTTLTTDPTVAAVTVGWLACAIPSPQDFSVVFHAHDLLDRADDHDAIDAASCAD